VSSKVYILLGLTGGNPGAAARTLNGMLGVKNVEILEGSPELLVVLEARHRKQLAELTVKVLEAVNDTIGSVKLLPVMEPAVATARSN